MLTVAVGYLAGPGREEGKQWLVPESQYPAPLPGSHSGHVTAHRTHAYTTGPSYTSPSGIMPHYCRITSTIF